MRAPSLNAVAGTGNPRPETPSHDVNGTRTLPVQPIYENGQRDGGSACPEQTGIAGHAPANTRGLSHMITNPSATPAGSDPPRQAIASNPDDPPAITVTPAPPELSPGERSGLHASRDRQGRSLFLSARDAADDADKSTSKSTKSFSSIFSGSRASNRLGHSATSASRSFGSKEHATFVSNFDLSNVLHSTVLNVSTSKGLDDFCESLNACGIGPDAIEDIKRALDGEHEFASASVLAEVRKTVLSTHRSVADQEEQVTGITLVGEETRAAYRENYPRLGKSTLRQRVEIMIVKLLELLHRGNLVNQSTDGFDALRREIEFWAEAEICLLEKGMPRQDITATRERYLTEKMAVLSKAEHLKAIAERCIAANENIYSAMNGDIQSLDDLLRDYKSTRKHAEHFPDDVDIDLLRDYLSIEVRIEGFDQVDIFSPEGMRRLQQAPAAQREQMQTNYESAKERIVRRFKDEYLVTWMKDLNTGKHLQGWPKELVDRAENLKKLVLTSPAKKTQFLHAMEKGDLRRAWTLDAAMTEANKPRLTGKRGTAKNEKKLTRLSQADAERVRAWMSEFYGKGIEKMTEANKAD